VSADAARAISRIGAPTLVFVVHGWGGGVRRHVDDLAALVAGRVNVLFIEPAAGGTVCLRGRESGETMHFELPADLTLLARVLRALGAVRLHFHHLHGLPQAILDLPAASALPYDVTLHDYLAICPQYQLVTEAGRYCGEPDADGCAACLAKRPPQWPLDITAWRAALAGLLLGADRVIAPSQDVASRIARYVGGLRCDVWRHPESPFAVSPVTRVATLGMLSREKGFDQMVACAWDAQARDLPLAFRVIGATAAPLPPLPLSRLSMSGEFREGDLAALIAAERPDVLWFPVQWPETYTYTLSAALASRIPIVASQVGAMTERLAGRGDVRLLPWDATAGQWNETLVALAPPRPVTVAVEVGTAPQAYVERYLEPVWRTVPPAAPAWPSLQARNLRPPSAVPAPDMPLADLAVAGALCGRAEAKAVLISRSAQADTDLVSLAAALGKTQAHVAEIEQQVSDTRDALGRAHEHSVQLQRHIGELEQALAQAQARKAELVWRMDVARTALLQAESETAEARARIVDLERHASTLEGALARAERDAADARARIADLEGSRSWHVTAPMRWIGGRARAARARALAGLHGLRQVPRRTAIAMTILRDEGPRALASRIARKLSGGARFRPAAQPLVAPATAIAPLAFPKVDSPRVSIVIPMYGKAQLTYTCLASLAAETPLDLCEVIVVDDASPEPAAESLAVVDGVRFERNAENLGFIGSCNRGAEIARGEYVVFLNNDTVVTRNWLEALLAVFERHSDAGLAGAKLVYPDGRLQEAGGIVWRDGSAWNVGRNDDPDRPEFNYVREADYCSGACLMIPAALFRDLGGFDRRYAPAYYEDTDLAFAVRAAGRRVYYQPAAKVVHFEGQTSGTDESSGIKRHQDINRHAFLAKWSHVLAGHRNNGMHPELERDRRAARRVLVIEACMLTPDQDSGSVRTQAMLEIAVEMGSKVTFVADNLEHRQPYVADLQARGVEVLFAPYVTSIAGLLEARGAEFDVVIVARHYIAVKHLDAIRRFAPRAVVAFDTVDLHFLRSERLAELDGGAAAKAAARASRDEELAVIRRVDVTLVVSPIEVEVLRREAPEAQVLLLTNIHEPIGGGRPLAERDGIVFIGGFQHPPNTDAVLWYAREVLPLLRVRLPGVKTTIVGSKVPATIRALAAPDFVVAGYVPDVSPFFTGCRVSIAPLRYGAGVKGKVNLAMSYGLPVVATSAAVEGMHLTPGDDVLIADDAEGFGAAIERLYRDDLLWNHLAAAGVENIRRHFSRAVARRALEELLAMAPPERSAGRGRPLLAVAGGR
jgi:GT2 family glycosyltransferase